MSMSKRKASQFNIETIRWPTSKPYVDQHVSCNENHFHIGADAFLKTTIEQDGLVSRHQDRILAAAKRTPRYLFRAWHRQSAGSDCGRYNSKAEVTPRAFAKGRQHHLLFDMKQFEYDQIAADHVLAGSNFETVFSSWSQSLLVVLSIALNSAKDRRNTGIHISIIDTKLLSPANVIINTTVAEEMCPSIWPFEDEFLAFGTIAGPGYYAVSFDAIKDKLTTFVIEDPEIDTFLPVCTTWEKCVESTRAIATFFPPRFQAPFAAHLLTIHNPHHQLPTDCNRRGEDIVALLSTFDDEIVHSLVQDNTIMEPGYAATYGHSRADWAAEQLRGFVYARLGRAEVEALRRNARPADETSLERAKAYRAAQKETELGSV